MTGKSFISEIILIIQGNLQDSRPKRQFQGQVREKVSF